MTGTVRDLRITCIAALAFALWALSYRIKVVANSGLTAWEMTYIANWVCLSSVSAVTLWRLQGKEASEVTRFGSRLALAVTTLPLTLAFVVGLVVDGFNAWSVVALAITGSALVAALLQGRSAEKLS